MKLISLLKLVELVMICTWSPSNPEGVRNLKQSKKRRQSLKLPVLSYCSVDCIFFFATSSLPLPLWFGQSPWYSNQSNKRATILNSTAPAIPKMQGRGLAFFRRDTGAKGSDFSLRSYHTIKLYPADSCLRLPLQFLFTLL